LPHCRSWFIHESPVAYGEKGNYSDTISQIANFTFNDTQFSMVYTGYSNRGDMDVYIDDTLVETIDQYSQSVTWQNAWYSPVWTDNDPHTIRLVNASGDVLDIDAIIFSDTVDIMDEGTHDSTNSKIFGKGDWVDYTLANAYNGSTLYSETVGDTVSFLFDGRQLSLLYTGYYTRGELLIQIDGQTIDLLNQFTLDVTYQNRWDGPVLPPGLHTVTLTHSSGQVVDVDAIIISDPESLTAGTHNDDHAEVQYSGDWTVYTDASAYDGNARYSETIGNTVNFSFVGTQLGLLYTGYSNRGEMEVYIDGILEDTINQYSQAVTWQNQWDSSELSYGLHTVQLVHASGLINDLDAIIVTDSTATATPTATPNLTPTVTPTITGTLTGTSIPTETPPPPLQSAEYFYDGDGNMVKGVVNGVKTYYPGRHYNEEVDGSTSTVKKFYTMGSTTVAVRTVSGTEDVLNRVLGDHLGSASVTANADGSWNSEIKYTAFGEVRASSGLTPTEYRYTGQLEQNSLGLYFYVARWYDPYLNQFAQPDSIIPEPANAANWNRYAYTNYNPINFNDPSGHAAHAGGGAAEMWDGYWTSEAPAVSRTEWSEHKMGSYYRIEEAFDENPNDPEINYCTASTGTKVIGWASVFTSIAGPQAQITYMNLREVDVLIGLHIDFYRDGTIATPGITVINNSDLDIQITTVTDGFNTDKVFEPVQAGDKKNISIALPPYKNLSGELIIAPPNGRYGGGISRDLDVWANSEWGQFDRARFTVGPSPFFSESNSYKLPFLPPIFSVH